jgi:tRNA modification GTPase
MEDTIAAISTAAGPSGIAIIRVSGPRALAVADAVFTSSRGMPSTFPSHTIHFGAIHENGDLLDRVMLSVMRAPRTYTGEDTVEINCHGGTFIARKVLAACLRNGARLAEPGEFTKRAFLNGKMDLTQAEAVIDLISARSALAQATALHALEGQLAARVNLIRDALVEVLAHIEAHIDFPEEDIAPATLGDLRKKLLDVSGLIQELLRTAPEGKILREGLRVTIVGRPNSGKSSLLNALLGEERAIVTPIAGTTRDTLEECASIGGIPVILTDTAGIRESTGHVERLGVERSRKSVAQADVVLHVLDLSKPASRTDLTIADHYAERTALLVLNKADLPRRLKLQAQLQHLPQLEVSCRTGEGLSKLRKAIEAAAWTRTPAEPFHEVVLNDRQVTELGLANQHLTDVIHQMERLTELDVVAQTLRSAIAHVNYTVGKDITEDVLSKIFSTFCIGK